MNHLKRKILIIAVLSATITASAQTDLTGYLPENASAIISFNTNRLKQKMTWNELTQSGFFAKLTEKAPAEIKPLLTNPDSLGLDKNPEVIIAIVGDEKNPKNGYGAAFIRMKNEAVFAAAIQKLFKNRPVKTIGANKILIDQGGVFGWNKEMAVITVGENNSEFRSAKTAKAMTAATENKFKTLTDRCIKLLTPKINSSYDKDARFTSLMNEDADIRMWSTSSFRPLNDIIGKKKQQIKSDSYRIPAQLKGGVKAAVINFENGKVVWQTRNYLAKSIDSLYKIYPGNKINTHTASRLPNGEMLAYISLNYPSDLFKALVEVSGLKEITKDAFKNSPLKGQNFNGALKGDITIAVIKADEFAMDDSVTQNLGGLQLFLTGSINDKTKFENLVASFKNITDSASSANNKAGKFFGGLKDGLKYNEKEFVLSLSPHAAGQFIMNTPSATVPAWLQSYASAPFIVSLDLKSIFSLAMQASKNNSDPELKEFTKNFERLVSYGGGYDTDHLNTTVEIQLSDKNENSLKQIVGLFNTLAELGMRSRNNAYPDVEVSPAEPKEKN